MRVLVTGGAGFIGSHLSERLLLLGHSVIAIDDLSTGNIENILAYRYDPAYFFHADTIFNRPLMSELVDSCDSVVHLAAAVGVKRIVEHPVQTIETNVSGTELVLKLAAKKAKRVIIASTSEVYGKSNRFPFNENDDLILGSSYNSRWGYACSKAIDEFLALAYFREKALPVTIVRLFNTVGPRQTGQYGMVLPTFVRQALTHAPVTVYGTGEQSRCFGHVQDIVEGFISILLKPATAGEIFNLGNTEEVTINQLAARVIKLAKSSSPVHHICYSAAYGAGFEDMFRRVPDISKAHTVLGYRPIATLNEIIRDVIEHESAKRANSLPFASFRHASNGNKPLEIAKFPLANGASNSA